MAAADTSSRNQPAAGGRLLRVGRHEVDLDRRLVALAGTQETRRLTLKAMQVLLALAEAGGRVVSREQ
jgi:Response regulators consisting of a CheY-like receiver domain and a winged-helix DNA-binding domain